MQLLYFLEGMRTPWLDTFFSAVTNLGSEAVFMAAALICYWCADKGKAIYLMAAGFAGTLVSQTMKLLFAIPRPWVRDPNFTVVEGAKADAGGYSFPSGHSQSAAAVYGTAALLSRRQWPRILCLTAIVLVALSRMYLGVHTPADVGVGLLVGILPVLALYPLFRNIRAHPRRVCGVLAGTVALSAAYLSFMGLYSWPEDIDTVQLAEGLKNAWSLLGASAGMLLAFLLDDRFIRFDTRASLMGQVLKVTLGLALLLGVRSVLKMPLLTLTGGHPIAHTLRYLLVALLGGAGWPLTFRWFARTQR